MTNSVADTGRRYPCGAGALVTAIGYVPIKRPAAESPRATDGTMQHHGAPS